MYLQASEPELRTCLAPMNLIIQIFIMKNAIEIIVLIAIG